jgi:sugar/nucleoside kinase (ribokinase family)
MEVVCLGLSCVDVLVRGFDRMTAFRDEICEVESIKLGVGGDAVNQAMTLSRLGVGAKLVCGVGRDDAGLYLRDRVAESGADISGIQYSDGYSTGITVVVIAPDGQRHFIAPPAANRLMYEPDPEVCAGARVVSIASIMLRPFITADSVLRLVKPASERGSLICADVVAHKGLCSFEDFYPALPYIDYFFPNEEEAKSLTGRESLDDIADFMTGRGVKNVVIKTGRDGCFLKGKDIRLTAPAFDSPVVDTTGAGDNFAAGFIKSLIEGRSPADCCRYANAVASVAVGSVGANTGVKSAAQIDEFIAAHRQFEAK